MVGFTLPTLLLTIFDLCITMRARAWERWGGLPSLIRCTVSDECSEVLFTRRLFYAERRGRHSQTEFEAKVFSLKNFSLETIFTPMYSQAVYTLAFDLSKHFADDIWTLFSDLNKRYSSTAWFATTLFPILKCTN